MHFVHPRTCQSWLFSNKEQGKLSCVYGIVIRQNYGWKLISTFCVKATKVPCASIWLQHSYPTVPMAFCTKAMQWEAERRDESSKVRWKPMRMTLDLTPLLMGQQWSQLASDNGFKHFTSIAPVLKLSHVSQIVVLLQAAKSRSFWEAFSTACYRTSVVSLVTKVAW